MNKQVEEDEGGLPEEEEKEASLQRSFCSAGSQETVIERRKSREEPTLTRSGHFEQFFGVVRLVEEESFVVDEESLVESESAEEIDQEEARQLEKDQEEARQLERDQGGEKEHEERGEGEKEEEDPEMLAAGLRRPSNLLLHSVEILDRGGDLQSAARRHRLFENARRQLARSAANAKAIAERAQEAGRRRVAHLQQKPPLCFRILNRAYHRYGLKHLVLILFFIFYTAVGAFIFLLVESPVQNELKRSWANRIASNRSRHVDLLMKQVFNNSDYLIYVKANTSERLREHFIQTFSLYEDSLGIRWSEQRMEWDYWNALLFAGTLCTTIGYGHIYPLTNIGKVLTMVFALFGIPLMLLVLQDFGKLLTMTMKFPWFQLKRLARRILRCCTKQSLREMREIEAQERRDLEIFDLPLIVGVSLVVAWVWLCSVVMSFWDQHWSFLEAFYFFFISLSTIGLGDLVPRQPRLLIIMFGFILVGLSLVSMVVNLLQARMRKTYEAGRDELDEHNKNNKLDDRFGTSLGVLQVFGDDDELKIRDDDEEEEEESISRATQTSLSLPTTRNIVLGSDGVHWVEDACIRSPDEVTQLVELESGLAVCAHIGEYNRDTEDEQEQEEEPSERDGLLASPEE